VSRPNDQWIARYDEAVYQLALGNVDQCIAELRAILVDYPDCLDAQLALGNAHLRKEELQEALQETLKAVEMEPENQMAQMNLSIIYMRMGDKEKAEHHALQAKLIYWKKSGKEPPPFLRQATRESLDVVGQNPPPQPMIFTKKKTDLENPETPQKPETES
jgi:predicted Zn-dependent protease